MTRSRRDLYVEALDALMRGEMGVAVLKRDFELLAEIARLARDDAAPVLASADPALFASWRAAVTRYHLGGWTNMTPQRVERVQARYGQCTGPFGCDRPKAASE